MAAKTLRTVVVFPVPGGVRGGRRRPALPPRRAGWRRKASLLDLGVAVVEVLGEVRKLEDLGIPKERLVGAEEGRMRHTSLWRRGGC
jgi:hypothetical protein